MGLPQTEEFSLLFRSISEMSSQIRTFENLAHPTGFEPVTSAFGGQLFWVEALCWTLLT